MRVAYRMPLYLYEEVKKRKVKTSQIVREAIIKYSADLFQTPPGDMEKKLLQIYMVKETRDKIEILQKELPGIDRSTLITSALRNLLNIQ